MATKAVTRVATPAKAYSYFKMVISGFIESTQTWSCGLAFKSNPNTSHDDMQTWLSAAVPDVVNWWTSGLFAPSTQNTSDTQLSSLRLYHYLAGQRQATNIAEVPLPAHPGDSTFPGTARDSLVVGLYGPQPGAHYRGRIYVPTTGPRLEGNHQFNLAIPTQFVSNTVGLLAALGARQMGGINPLPVIASSLPVPPVVTTVRGDTIPDTQRRRSDQFGQQGEFIQTLVFV